MNVHLVLILAYSVVLVLIALLVGRMVKTSGAFFVAGRNLGPVLLFATMLAANIGSGSTVGAARIGYEFGWSGWWWVGSAGIGSMLLAFWLGPRIWRLAVEHDLRTVGDYLELRYDKSVRGTMATLLWVQTLFALAAQLVAVATILNVVAGVPMVWGCLMGGAVLTTYFTAGGLLTSAWVNLVQLVVLLAGFALVLPFALSAVGGLEGLVAASREANPELLHPWSSGGRSGLYYLALLVPAFIVSPGLLQKIYGARDARTVRIGVAASGVVLLAFAAISPTLGMVARALFPDINPTLALATLFASDELPLLLGSLGLAAVFSAEVSSSDAILFMLSTSLSRDLYHRFVNPEADDATVLRVARGAAIAGGVLGVVLAVALQTVIGALTIFYSLLSVTLFVPLVAGLYTRRPGTPEALVSMAAGLAVCLAVHLGTSGEGYGVWNPTLIGLLVAGAGFAAVAVVRGARRGERE